MNNGETICWEVESIVFVDAYGAKSCSIDTGFDILVFNGQYAQIGNKSGIFIVPWQRIVRFVPLA